MRTSETYQKAYAAYIQAKSEVVGAVKDSKNPHFGNTFATLASTTDALKPAFNKHGLDWIQGVVGSAPAYTLVTRVIHISGEWFESDYPLTSKDWINPQAVGSANTYARRYGLQTATGLPSIDDDGHAATDKPAQTPMHQPAPPLQNHAPVQAKFQMPKDVQERASSSLGDYVIKMGKKKGLKLSEVPKHEIKGLSQWLQDQASKDGKPLSGPGKEFVEMADKYLSHKPDEPPMGIDPDEEIPF